MSKLIIPFKHKEMDRSNYLSNFVLLKDFFKHNDRLNI